MLLFKLLVANVKLYQTKTYQLLGEMGVIFRLSYKNTDY